MTDNTPDSESKPTPSVENEPAGRQGELFPEDAARPASRAGLRRIPITLKFNEGWKNVALTLGAFSLVLLVVVSWLLWFEMSKRFPNLDAGSYAGAIQGIFPGESEGQGVFYVERKPNSDKLLFVLFRQDWQPQVVTSASSGNDSKDGEWLLPISINGPDAKLRFIGSKEGAGEFGGKVVNLNNGTQGSWNIKQIVQESPAAAEAASEIQAWLQKRSELEDIDNRIARAEAEIPRQRAEINKLTDFITEGSKLKSRAQQKLDESRQELTRREASLKSRREEARNLEQQFDLSHRVRGLGKLVSLGRESLEREAHWVSSMMDSDLQNVPPDLEVAVDKSKKIIELKRELAEERARIDRLEHAAAEQEEPAEEVE
jgi:hypothetical protein